jgi:hypothetical protein
VKERSALAEPKFSKEAFHLSAEVLIEGIVRFCGERPSPGS